MNDTRSRFEELAEREGWNLARRPKFVDEHQSYMDSSTRMRWYVFQAAEAQAVRACVEIVRKHAVNGQTLLAAIRAAFPHVKE